MSLLFDNACDAFDVKSACRCRVPEGGITAGEFDRIPVKTIAERAQYISSLTEDNGRIHIPLHKEDSPTLSGEYVTYVDHDLRGKLFIFGPEDDKTTVDAERVATSQVGQRLRFWTSGYTPDSYPEYYSSPVDVVEEASDVVNEDFFQELRDYLTSSPP